MGREAIVKGQARQEGELSYILNPHTEVADVGFILRIVLQLSSATFQERKDLRPVPPALESILCPFDEPAGCWSVSLREGKYEQCIQANITGRYRTSAKLPRGRDLRTL